MEAIDRRARMDDATDSFAANLAKQIKARREKLGWSQEILALESGLSREAIRQLEAAKGAPNVKTVYRIARAMGLKPENLVGRDGRGISQPNGYQGPRPELEVLEGAGSR